MDYMLLHTNRKLGFLKSLSKVFSSLRKFNKDVDEWRLCGREFHRSGAVWEKSDERRSLRKLADATGGWIERI